MPRVEELLQEEEQIHIDTRTQMCQQGEHKDHPPNPNRCVSLVNWYPR